MSENTKIQWADCQKRFWKKVSVRTVDECWQWNAAILKNGYGAFSKGVKMGIITAHRAAFILTFGDVCDGLVIDHLCRNRACCNPAHLEAVTTGENTRRGLCGRLVVRCVNGHDFTPENTAYKPTGQRICIACRRARDKGRRNAEWWRQYRKKRKVEHGS